MYVLHNDASATRGSLASFRSASQAVFAAFRVFFIDKILRLDGHVDNVWSVMVELRICVDGVRSRQDVKEYKAYLSVVPCRQAVSRKISIVLSLDLMAFVPIL
jgi:hypothetical protein